MKHGLKFFLGFLFVSSLVGAQPQTGYWEGMITHQKKEWKVALEFEKADASNIHVFVDFVEIGGYRRQFTMTQEQGRIRLRRSQPDGRPALVFDGVLTRESFVGTFDGIGITGASFALKPASRTAFTTEEVVFYHDDVKLAGTLLIPVGEASYPAVVITHGSGPDTRMLYYGIAMDFVKKGVAALIYDKRGNGQSAGGDYRGAGISDLAKDALAGVKLLQRKAQINARQIGVFGHSQGGWIAPMAAVLSADVAFVITSAASGVTATEQSVYHRANVMRADGFPEAAVEQAIAIRTKLNAATRLCFVDSVAARHEIKRVAHELNLIKDEPWFESSALPQIPYPGCPSASVMELLFKEPSEIWSRVKVPVYAVWGKKDMVVPVEKISVITEALNKAGNTHVSTKIIPDTDHSFLVIREDGEWDFPRESAGYFSDMAVWIHSIFQTP